ncbi:MAG: hypothetical protein ACTSW1_09955 [Candidatus Hodarchaeales archaeon]
MKWRNIVLVYVLFFMLSLISLFTIELLSNNIQLNSDAREQLSHIGLLIYEVFFSLTTGLILTIGFWNLTKRFRRPEKALPLLVFDILVSTLTLLFFESVTSIIYVATISLFEGHFPLIGLQFDPVRFIDILRLDFLLVCVFYSYIAFQSARKNKIKSNELTLADRLLYDFLQITVIFFCLVLGPIPLFYNPEIDITSTLLVILYYVTIAVVILDVNSWLDFQNELSKITEFTYRLQSLFVPFIILIHSLPSPFFLLLYNLPLYVSILVIGISISYLISYLAVKPTKSSPRLARIAKNQIQKVIYYYESTLASRGIAFGYPEPIDIIQPSGKANLIEARYQKVKLKMACGQCFHVFEAETYKVKGKIKPIQCPFCHSNATTPVWE